MGKGGPGGRERERREGESGEGRAGREGEREKGGREWGREGREGGREMGEVGAGLKREAT